MPLTAACLLLFCVDSTCISVRICEHDNAMQDRFSQQNYLANANIPGRVAATSRTTMVQPTPLQLVYTSWIAARDASGFGPTSEHRCSVLQVN